MNICFSRKQWKNHPSVQKRVSTTRQAFWCKLTIAWIFPLFNLGYKKDLEHKDLYACPTADDPEMWADALEQ